MTSNLWIDELQKLVRPEALFRDEVDLLGFTRDASIVQPGMPAVAVRPVSAEEVGTVLAFAQHRKVPVYARGAGSMYAGGAVPSAGGIVLDLAALDRILEIDEARGLVVVETGVNFGVLLKALRMRGLTVGVVPLTGPSGTVGGTVSSHGLGTGSSKFQSLGDEVAGLEVVLADGSIVRTGSAASRTAGFFQRYCIGPDLTGLFVGANSVFGVITKVALWLHPIPAHAETLCLGFRDVASGTSFLTELQRLEMTRNIWYGAVYDGATVKGKMAALRLDVAPESLPNLAVGIDLRGDADDVARDRAKLIAMAEARGGGPFDVYDEIFFRKLRHDNTFWYSFAGYCTLSRSALLMGSLPTERMPDFLEMVTGLRKDHTEFVWGGGVVLCKRGLHAGVIGFYDEAKQWQMMQKVFAGVRHAFLKIGGVPYKSGQLWSDTAEAYPDYLGLLGKIRGAIDPAQIMGRGNLGT